MTTHVSTAARWLLLAATAAIGGCAIIPDDAATRANKPATGPPVPTRATQRIGAGELPGGGTFIGIAMSGGGSRAANFSAAALLELDRIGILRNAAAISSVSGSSLTAAYYARHGDDPRRWNKDALQNTFIYDFDRDWTTRWLLPHNILRYWLTPFDRSDIMKRVFDNRLFDGAQVTFRGLGAPRQTKILINATAIAGGEGFVFTDEAFAALGSSLANYPVAHAVMASAAFPAAFNSVTLEDYQRGADFAKEHPGGSQRFYKHLYDGGPSGNLGVNALKRTLFEVAENQSLAGCVFVLVDAYPISQEKAHKGDTRRDLRSLLGYLVDENMLDAFDDLLTSQRLETLRALGYPPQAAIGAFDTWDWRPAWSERARRRDLTCHVWHLTMERNDPEIEALKRQAAQAREQEAAARTPNQRADPAATKAPAGAGQDDAELYKKGLNIATDFRLVHPAKGDPQELQQTLFCAAEKRVQASEPVARRWLFEELHLTPKPAPGPPAPSSCTANPR